MSELNFFLPITKIDKAQRMVWGYASTPTLDLDGEVVELDAIRAALPDYMEWRNIREMHQPSAVGIAKEANIDEKGLYLGAKIVDDGAWQKVEEGVYKGFSIGGNTTSRDGNRITGLDLIEISIVDRPANPDCKIDAFKAAKPVENASAQLVKVAASVDGDLLIPAAQAGPLRKFFAALFGVEKREFSDKERDRAASSGAAMPDGSFPIESEQDLRNAIEAHGRAKNPEAAKQHIISRAHALDATNLLPPEWERQTKTAAAAAQPTDPAAVTGGTTIDDDRSPFDQLKEHLEMANIDELVKGFQLGNLNKRVTRKEAVTMAADCVNKAAGCHKAAMGHLAKCAGAMRDHMKSTKAADGGATDHMAAAIEHMGKAKGAMDEMESHHDMAAHYLGKAAGSEGKPGDDVGGDAEDTNQNALTGGNVPEYDATGAYPGKAASYDKELVDRLIAAESGKAAAEARVEVLQSLPLGGPRAIKFPVGKAANGGQQSESATTLMKGVNFNPQSKEEAHQSGAAMLTNMFENEKLFAKSVTDPGFRGHARS